jgi:hypothetical protein
LLIGALGYATGIDFPDIYFPDIPYIPSEDEAEDILFDILTNDFYGPDDPTDPESWKKWEKERDIRIYDETTCETRAPWIGPGKGYDPEDPDNDPKAPLWKKIARAIMDLIRAGNP